MIIKPSTFFDTVLSCTFILSPAILLGFERTNADLILFIFLYWAIIVSITYRDSIGQIISAAIIGFSTVLKIYPTVAITELILIQNRLKLILISLTVCMLIIVLWYWTHPSELAYVLAVAQNRMAILCLAVAVYSTLYLILKITTLCFTVAC